MNDENQNSVIQENDMDLDEFDIDEWPIEADNDCGDACKI